MAQLVDRAYVPKGLHLPPDVAGMAPDTVMMIIVAYVIWTLLNSWYFIWIVFAIPWGYATIKADKPRGYMQHALVKYGFYKLHMYPPTDVELFCE